MSEALICNTYSANRDKLIKSFVWCGVQGRVQQYSEKFNQRDGIQRRRR